MKYQLILEEIAIFMLTLIVYSTHNFSLLSIPIFILIPDISMIGYLKSPKLGALTYNFIHNRTLAIGLLILGSLINNYIFVFASLILLMHISMDRVFGYGLKYQDKFKHTHLDEIK